MAAYFNRKTKKWDANFAYRDYENNSRKKMKRGFETEEEALALSIYNHIFLVIVLGC